MTVAGRYKVVVEFESQEDFGLRNDDPQRIIALTWKDEVEQMLEVSEWDFDENTLSIDIEEV